MNFIKILAFLLLSHCVYAQKLFTELTVNGKVSDIAGMMIQDDIFLNMNVTEASGKISPRSYLIHPDSTRQEFVLNPGYGKSLVGGVR